MTRSSTGVPVGALTRSTLNGASASPSRTRDALWTYSSEPSTYSPAGRGWDAEQYGRWVGDVHIAVLLPR